MSFLDKDDPEGRRHPPDPPRRRRQGHRPRQFRRRHDDARHAVGQDQAQPARACPHRVDQHRQGDGVARRQGGDHPRRFPGHPAGQAFIGAAPANLRDLSRNCMASGKALYEGHAVAAVAATSPAIAEQALELIEVEYEVLPHVMDVEAAMAADAPVLHDDIFTAGVEPKPTKPSNVAKMVRFAKGDVEAGFAEADVVIERRYTTKPVHQGYIEPHACVVSVGAGRPNHDLELEPGPVHGPRLHRAHRRRRHRQHPRDPGRDRRRLWRQDDRLSRAGRLHAVEEVGPAGQDRDEPRGGVPGDRADLGRGRRSQARRQEGRPDRRRQGRAQIPVGRVSGLAGPAGLHLRLCALRPAERRVDRLRRAQQSPQGRRLSRAGRADLGVRGRKLPRRAGRASSRSIRWSCARRTAPRTAPRRRTARPGPISAISKTLEAAQGASAVQGAARPQPGARHRLRLLAQCRRRIERRGARQRGRHGHRDRGPSRHRRLARLDGDDGGRGAGRSVRERPPGRRRHRRRSASAPRPAAAASPLPAAWR